MNEQELISKKEQIQGNALEALNKYLEMDLKDIDTKIIGLLYNRAKLGMQFEKEMNLSKRANELNFIRIGKLIYEDKNELRQYINKSLPRYSVI